MVPPDNQIDLKNIEGIKNLVDEGGYDVEQLLSVLNALNVIKKNDKKKEDKKKMDKSKGLTEKQKKLPKQLKEAIMKKKIKNNYIV